MITNKPLTMGIIPHRERLVQIIVTDASSVLHFVIGVDDVVIAPFVVGGSGRAGRVTGGERHRQRLRRLL